MSSGGGGSSAPAEQTIYNTSLPEYVEPYFKNKLAIKMTYSKEIIYTSSPKTPSFRKWLEG